MNTLYTLFKLFWSILAFSMAYSLLMLSLPLPTLLALFFIYAGIVLAQRSFEGENK